jgi:hypothetical protein
MSKKPKRPRDGIGNAVHIMKVLTGEIEEVEAPPSDKDPAAVAMGRKGGKARADKLSKEERSAIARKAAKKRWSAKE